MHHYGKQGELRAEAGCADYGEYRNPFLGVRKRTHLFPPRVSAGQPRDSGNPCLKHRPLHNKRRQPQKWFQLLKSRHLEVIDVDKGPLDALARAAHGPRHSYPSTMSCFIPDLPFPHVPVVRHTQ
jgi:hypothetical protein